MSQGKKERVAVYIDGSNLYHKLCDQELNVPRKREFNYKGLCEYLARDRKLTYVGYYIGVVRAKESDEKGQQMRKNQQTLFNRLMEQGILIKRGQLVQQADGYHEKGVDVQIAVDMLIGAYGDLYDRAIVVSSDTDLIPAIKQVKTLGKDVEYIGFSHKPTLGLQRHATESRLLIKEELEPFISKTPPLK